MFLGQLNTIVLNISNDPFHLELVIHSIQIVVLMSFDVITNFGIRRANCTFINRSDVCELWNPQQL